MAHLDVRERRIEATIAYIGPELAGRTTNLRRLGGMADRAPGERSATDDVVSIEWRPVGMPRFDDCDVAVRIVAPRGALTEGNVSEAIDTADGVVLVLDADPAARERNRSWLEPARHLLGARAGRPVVVQINKADLVDAVPLGDLLADLGIGDWPHILASATRGEGVVETVRRALEGVLGAIETEETPAGDGSVAKAPRADAHPLLTALRQVLRECIDERVGAIEERLVERVAEATAARVGSLRADLGEVAGDLARVHREVTSLRAEQAETRLTLGAELAALAAEVTALAKELGTAVAADRASIATVEKRLAAEAHASEKRLAAEAHASEKRVLESVATAARDEKEHVTAAATALRKSVDALRVELRRDVSTELSAVEARLQSLAQKIDETGGALLPAAGALKSLPLRLGESQDRTRNALLASLEELGRRVEVSVQGLGAEAVPVWQRIDERSAKVESAVDELFEELKKQKKGWFR